LPFLQTFRRKMLKTMRVPTTPQRSRMMSSIRGKNTGPERILRSLLFARGFRYRLHVRGLPGSPDLVFPTRKAVVFVHGRSEEHTSELQSLMRISYAVFC